MWQDGLKAHNETIEKAIHEKVLEAIRDQNVLAFGILLPHLKAPDQWQLSMYRAFHNSMCSKTLGYGFPNPKGPRNQAEVSLLKLLEHNVSRFFETFEALP